MAVFNSLTFDGENSLDYGVYITGEAVYNAPERAVELISIPGRNGAIALDQGRFENIEVTYPAGTFGDDQPEFASKIRAFRNALASRFNYVKLTDSYHPDEYRLGLYKSGLTTTPVQRSKAGEFPITFNCKPQRFLTSGETEVDGAAWSNVQTETDSIVTIDNSDGNLGIESLIANIEPLQSGSGTPSTSNIRDISGWADTSAVVAGKNLWIDSSAGYTTGKLISSSGSISSNSGYKYTNWYTPVKASQTYSIQYNKISSIETTTTVACYDSDKNFLSRVVAISSTTNTGVISGSFTTPSTCAYIRVNFNNNNNTNIQLEEGATATSYVAPVIYTTELGQTVYGGTLDVVSGLLTVTHKMITVDGDSVPFASKSGTTSYDMYFPAYLSDGYLFGISNAYVSKSAGVAAGMICNAGEFTSSGEGYQAYVSATNGLSLRFAFPLSMGLSTLELANEWCQSNPIQFVYKLATPLTYQLTPKEIGLMVGSNMIWADSGTVTIQYGNSPVYNPTEFDARPLIRIGGTGTVVVGGTAITITGSLGQTIYIDCDSMEIYTLSSGAPQSAASRVSFSGNDFPVLKPGSNSVSLGTGITSVTITPRWWII